MWRFLAPLLAARRSMRLASPGSAGKFGTSRPTLSPRLPKFPAAVPLYDAHGCTVLLALDFDAKLHGSARVDADVELALSWLRECGARTVTDTSTSGGRHILVPLVTDTPLPVGLIRPLLALLEKRLPTFDKSPMLGTSHGCISVPGSVCREGGNRQLDGSLADAVEAFTVRSDRGVVACMIELLGGVEEPQLPPRTAVAAAQALLTCAERLIGSEDATRHLHPSYCLTSPVPATVAAFARAGTFDADRWPSPSEARQSVISHAVLRGASAADIEALLGSEDYAGLRKAYARYGSDSNITTALHRDVAKALPWAASHATRFRDPTHKNKHTGGDHSRDPIRGAWLAAARSWIDQEFLLSRQRPALLAVVQALAYSSALAGELVEGVPVVATGGRSLSHAAGLLSENVVWAALRVLRDTAGSPLLRVARGTGQLPDRYALTTPALGRSPSRAAIARAHVEPVHQAWSVIGLRARGLYDLIHAGEVATVKDALAAARVGTSAGYEALADLRVAGLITMDNGALALGQRTLDQVADAAGLDAVAEARVLRHRAERVVWHAWLNTRFGPPPPDHNDAGQHEVAVTAAALAVPVLDAHDSELMWAATMAAGPPQTDPLLDALDLLGDQLGAVIVPAST